MGVDVVPAEALGEQDLAVLHDDDGAARDAEALPLGLHEGTDLLDDPHACSLG
ncbi:MAG: hypothetical protein JWP14_489 [Frankiales bacterium]|nr:hypothetical protein [Frankiales bacterium]